MKWNSNHENVHLQSALIRAPLCGRPTAIRPSARPTVHLFFWNIFYPFCLVLIAIISLHTQKAFWWRLCSWCQGIFSSLGTICMYSTCMLKMKGMTDLFRNPFFLPLLLTNCYSRARIFARFAGPLSLRAFSPQTSTHVSLVIFLWFKPDTLHLGCEYQSPRTSISSGSHEIKALRISDVISLLSANSF